MSTTSKLNQRQPAASSLPAEPVSPGARFLHAPEFDHVSKVVS